MPYADAIPKHVENWGKCGQRAIFRGRINFLNKKGKQFDWDNDDSLDLKAVDEQPALIHPCIISKIPGLETEAMYSGIVGPIPIGKEEKPPYAEHVVKAHNNAGLDAIDQARGMNAKKDEVIVINDGKSDTEGN